jgi:hypothetical protein
VGAFPLSASNDAAILSTLSPGGYTALVGGSGAGLALAEIYDADPSPSSTSRLVNLSVRGRTSAGDGVLILGFCISGELPLRVLVRALGPALSAFGVKSAAADPRVQLFRGNAPHQQNDDWGGASSLTAVFASVGASALADPRSKDAAFIATLEPGIYTVIVSEANGATGIVLAEIYELP